MDVSEVAWKPLKDFSKNSARLVKRCTKPDRRGACLAMPWRCCPAWVYGLVSPGMASTQGHQLKGLPRSSSCTCLVPLTQLSFLMGTLGMLLSSRVHESLRADGSRLYRHGVHRVLRQAPFHRECCWDSDCNDCNDLVILHGAAETYSQCLRALSMRDSSALKRVKAHPPACNSHAFFLYCTTAH